MNLNFKKLALITALGLLSVTFSNGAFACHPNNNPNGDNGHNGNDRVCLDTDSDSMTIIGTIGQFVRVIVDPTAVITMANTTPTTIDVDVEANVEFQIQVESINGLVLQHSDWTTGATDFEVGYTAELLDSSDAAVVTVNDGWSAKQDRIDTDTHLETWNLVVTTGTIDADQAAGVYTDTLQFTIVAVSDT